MMYLWRQQSTGVFLVLCGCLCKSTICNGIFFRASSGYKTRFWWDQMQAVRSESILFRPLDHLKSTSKLGLTRKPCQAVPPLSLPLCPVICVFPSPPLSLHAVGICVIPFPFVGSISFCFFFNPCLLVKIQFVLFLFLIFVC